MKQVILKGDDKTISAIMQENRIRVNRGLIEFAPVDPTVEAEDGAITDSKEVETSDSKSVNETDTKGKKTSKK